MESVFVKTYDQAVEYLTEQLPATAPKMLKDGAAFEHSQAVLQAIGNPQNVTPAIHIAATSGKGSMAYALSAILHAHGHTTTQLTSPHAYDIRERIQLNGTLINKAAFTRLTDDFLSKMVTHQLQPTYFEALMCMGFMAATQNNSHYLVVETGLGGLWDTSNTITHPDKLAIIGSIGYDHTHILGSTLEAIAAQKAGIMPLGGHAIVLRQSAAINQVFVATAKERHTQLHWIEPAPNAHDTNWEMALAAARFVAQRDNWAFDEARAKHAIHNLHIPARFEIRTLHGRTIVLDGAHNPQKAEALAAWLHKHFPEQKFTTIVAVSEGKDISGIVAALNPVTETYFATTFMDGSHDLPVHATPADTLGTSIKTGKSTQAVSVYAQPQAALQAALRATNNAPVLITGSFYLVGELGPQITRE